MLERLAKGGSGDDGLGDKGLNFCVDEAAQSRRVMAEMMSSEGEYELGWCVRALEESANDLGRARGWLGDWAPRVGEVVR